MEDLLSKGGEEGKGWGCILMHFMQDLIICGN